ncbi:MAG: hypothetical protein LUC48_10155 [Clostridiales bacterium]|nr:hypothetical protein [Clostridiales bacterium]
MLRDNEKFYLPNLHHFQNDNTFYGSFQGLRFRVKSEQVEEAGEKRWTIATLCWYGDFCLEESDVVAEARFPMSEEGYDQVLDWLEGQYRLMLDGQGGSEPQSNDESLGV